MANRQAIPPTMFDPNDLPPDPPRLIRQDAVVLDNTVNIFLVYDSVCVAVLVVRNISPSEDVDMIQYI